MNPITRNFKTENGDFLSVSYEMTENKESGRYGLRLREIRTSSEKLTEIPDITGNLLEIEGLIVVLSTYSVTSATVHDILEDLRADFHK